MHFCPTCHNLLFVSEDNIGIKFQCVTCPYVYYVNSRIATRTYPKLKELDEVLGGSAAWKNVDSTDAECPSCSNKRAYFMQIQIRSGDEPMTTFYKCCDARCGHNWRE